MATVANLTHTISVHSGDVNGVSFSSNTLATCSGDKTVRLWSLDDFTELPSSPLCGHSYSIHCCTFSPFGTLLASCSTDGKCILWDAKTGEKTAVFEHPSKGSIRVCRFSPNSSLIATGSDDETLCIWDVSKRKLVKCLEGHEDSVVAAAFSSDSAFVVTGCPSGDLRLFDAMYGHGKPLYHELNAHDLGISCCEFSPTYGSAGSSESQPSQIHLLLATCGFDSSVKLWDVLTFAGSGNIQLQLRDTLIGHDGQVMSCCFSPNGKVLASGAGDKTVRLWDPLKGEPIHTIEAHSRYVTSVAFSANGRMLASGSNDKQVKIWMIVAETELTDEVVEEDILVDLRDPSAKKTIEQWTVDDVCEWVDELGLHQYQTNFRNNAIDGTELLTLKNETLEKALGIGALGHRNKIMRAIQHIQEHPYVQGKEAAEPGVPDELLCPITREMMRDPVIAADGYTYEKAAISSWMSRGKTRSPMTNAVLPNTTLTPNRSLKMLIQRHLQAT